MLKSFKTAFGATIGVSLAIATLGFVKDNIMKWGADDEEYMDWAKKHDPKQYEELKKYQ